MNYSQEGRPFLRDNPYAWSTDHSIIYIDNPVGTGFSFTGKTKGLGYRGKKNHDNHKGLLDRVDRSHAINLSAVGLLFSFARYPFPKKNFCSVDRQLLAQFQRGNINTTYTEAVADSSAHLATVGYNRNTPFSSKLAYDVQKEEEFSPKNVKRY